MCIKKRRLYKKERTSGYKREMAREQNIAVNVRLGFTPAEQDVNLIQRYWSTGLLTLFALHSVLPRSNIFPKVCSGSEAIISIKY